MKNESDFLTTVSNEKIMKKVTGVILSCLFVANLSGCTLFYKHIVPGFYYYEPIKSEIKTASKPIKMSWFFGDATTFLKGRLNTAFFVDHKIKKENCLNVLSIHFSAISGNFFFHSYTLVEMDHPYNTGRGESISRNIQCVMRNDTVYIDENEELHTLEISQNFAKPKGKRYPKSLKMITKIAYTDCGSKEVKILADTSTLIRVKYSLLEIMAH